MYWNIRDNYKLKEVETEWDEDEDSQPSEADTIP